MIGLNDWICVKIGNQMQSLIAFYLNPIAQPKFLPYQQPLTKMRKPYVWYSFRK